MQSPKLWLPNARELRPSSLWRAMKRRLAGRIAESISAKVARADGEEHVLRTLCEGCAPYAEQLVVLVFENNQARVVASRGFESGGVFVRDRIRARDRLRDREPRSGGCAGTEAEISPVLAQSVPCRTRPRVGSESVSFPADRASFNSGDARCSGKHRRRTRRFLRRSSYCATLRASDWKACSQPALPVCARPPAADFLGDAHCRGSEAPSPGPAHGARASGRDAA